MAQPLLTSAFRYEEYAAIVQTANPLSLQISKRSQRTMSTLWKKLMLGLLAGTVLLVFSSSASACRKCGGDWDDYYKDCRTRMKRAYRGGCAGYGQTYHFSSGYHGGYAGCHGGGYTGGYRGCYGGGYSAGYGSYYRPSTYGYGAGYYGSPGYSSYGSYYRYPYRSYDYDYDDRGLLDW